MQLVSTQYLPFIFTLTLLVAYGVSWNLLVERLEREHVEGYTWAEVAGGVAVTVALAGFLIGWENVLILLLCFTASGAPMIWGAVRRHHVMLRHLLTTALGKDDDRKETAPAGEQSAPDDHRD